MSDEEVLTAAGATRALARPGVELSEASLKQAADRGEIAMVDRGVRLFKLADVRSFAKRRLA